MDWTKVVPHIDDVVVKECPHPELYYWVRGNNLNRPCLMRCNKGVNSKIGDDGKRKYWGQLNFQLLVEGFYEWPSIWYEKIEEVGWDNFEWCGPIEFPPK